MIKVQNPMKRVNLDKWDWGNRYVRLWSQSYRILFSCNPWFCSSVSKRGFIAYRYIKGNTVTLGDMFVKKEDILKEFDILLDEIDKIDCRASTCTTQEKARLTSTLEFMRSEIENIDFDWIEKEISE